MHKCQRCGECCRTLFGKKFGAAITTREKIRLEYLAKQYGVTVNFMPLTKNMVGEITTWQFSDRKCPFQTGSNECRIYGSRPLLCKAYPCMPYGVGFCHMIYNTYGRSPVVFSPEQASSGLLYIEQVASLIKSATWIYNMDKDRWEVNRYVPPKLTI